jgi:hypothetical protein
MEESRENTAGRISRVSREKGAQRNRKKLDRTRGFVNLSSFGGSGGLL